jgi:hypothetical protein
VREAFDFLATLGNVNILIEPKQLAPGATVTIKLNNVRLVTALKLCVEQLAMRYAIRGEVVYISKPDRIAAMLKHDAEVEKRLAEAKLNPRSAKTKAKLDSVIVSFTFNEQPLDQALEFLQTLGGVNIALDRRRFDPEKTSVTLKLTNMPLRTALVLLADGIGARACLRDGVVYITDAKTLAEGGWPELPVNGPPRKAKGDAERTVSF